MDKTYDTPIVTLTENQVFVFGANSFGLHGRGSAGFAMGIQRSLRDVRKLPVGFKGKWAEIGKIVSLKALKSCLMG